MTAALVVFAIGNPSRGDDAIGPVLIERLAAWLAVEGLAADIDLIEDFQLQIEHTLDLDGRQLALFIDAGEQTPGPFTFEQIEPSSAVAHTTHALAPEAVLQVYCQTEGKAPPPAFVLCVRGEGFELGEALTEAASVNVEAAWLLLMCLCRERSLAAWRGHAARLPR